MENKMKEELEKILDPGQKMMKADVKQKCTSKTDHGEKNVKEGQ